MCSEKNGKKKSQAQRKEKQSKEQIKSEQRY